jgi:hypothetical protein
MAQLMANDLAVGRIVLRGMISRFANECRIAVLKYSVVSRKFSIPENAARINYA